MKENWIYRRGDIYLVDLGKNIGSEQGGCRPVLLLQNNVGNHYAPTLIVAPISSSYWKKPSSRPILSLRELKISAAPRWFLQNSLSPSTRCV